MMTEVHEHTIVEEDLQNKEITIVDLGACLCEFTVDMDKIFNIKKAVLIEASPSNHVKHKDIIDTTNGRFISLNKAITSGETPTHVTFNEDEACIHGGSIVFDYFRGSLKQHTVETICLKTILEMFEPDEDIDILKIDVEGAEFDVLMNTEGDVLRRFKQITVEFHDFINPNFKQLIPLIENRLFNLGFEKLFNKSLSHMYGTDHIDTLFYRTK